jgi:hypothetical protein
LQHIAAKAQRGHHDLETFVDDDGYCRNIGNPDRWRFRTAGGDTEPGIAAIHCRAARGSPGHDSGGPPYVC